MNLDEIRTYCRNLKGAREDFPFGADTLVFKIGSKMFALIPLDAEKISINLKGDPFLNEEWRAQSLWRWALAYRIFLKALQCRFR